MKKNTCFGLLIMLIFSCQNTQEEYVCTPCNLSCDELTFSEPGICPQCNMDLIKKSDLPKEEPLVLNEVRLKTGSGVFLLEGGTGKKEKAIQVFYYKPETFQADSRILLVIPGAGRNGDSYRDAWIEEAEKYSVLILSPMYAEDDYSFEDYHLCGLMSDLDLKNSLAYVANSNVVNMDEDKFSFKVNEDRARWIFQDFDRIFDRVVEATNSTQSTYDIFGNSAGGQILHRFAIFQPQSKANYILAANSGFYTLPNFDSKLPFGLLNTPIKETDLEASFGKKLILFVGELDNQDETGGTLLRSPTVDKQGLHRLARGQFFYQEAKAIAAAKNLDFNWELKIIPDVGHNHREMGDAAGEFLYGEEENIK